MVIRRTPSDFRVHESLLRGYSESIQPGRSPGGAFALYELAKESMTTADALNRLARELRVPAGKVAAAGLKDKHAQTTQYATVDTRAMKLGPEAEPPTQVRPDGQSWEATRVGYVGAAISAAAIAHNHFVITVRDLTVPDIAEMNRRADALWWSGRPDENRGPGLLVVNYFGDQRFVSARHGAGFAARPLIRGDFEGAVKLLIGTPARKDSGKFRALTRACAEHWGDWPTALAMIPPQPERRAVEVLAAGRGFREAFEALLHLTRQMAVEAYQSWLWNAVARRLVESRFGGGSSSGIVPVLSAPDDFGLMLFPAASAVDPSLAKVEIPMPGPEVELAAPWAEAMESVLADEGLSAADLKIPGLRKLEFGAAARPWLATAAEFDMSRPEFDELGRRGRRKRIIRFVLPRGAYATVVLRSLGC